MPLTGRRRRQPDPLASVEAVRSVLDELSGRLPGKPKDEKEIVSLLRAAIHTERSPEARSTRGRRSKWEPRELAIALSILREILGRGTYGRKDARTFVDHYLRVLAFPADVRDALERGQLNLFEAEQLARVTPAALGVPPGEARTLRRRLLRAHLQSKDSGAQLRARVSALLASASPAPSAERVERFSPEVLEAAALLEEELGGGAEAIEADPSSVFFDLISTIAHALKDVDPDAISEHDQERIFEHGDGILLILNKIRRNQAGRPASRASLGFEKRPI